MIDMDWSMRSVIDKPMVAPSTCYSTEKDLEKKTDSTGFTLLYASDFLRAEIAPNA